VGDQFFRLAQAMGVACFGLAALYFAAPDLRLGRGAFGFGAGLMLLFSLTLRWLTDRFWHGAVPKLNVALVGAHDLARTTAVEIGRRADLNMRVVGFIETDRDRRDGGHDLDVLGHINDLDQILHTYTVEKLIVALD